MNRRAWMPGFGLLHGVDRERANCVERCFGLSLFNANAREAPALVGVSACHSWEKCFLPKAGSRWTRGVIKSFVLTHQLRMSPVF
jgi:hypothetical protein